MRRLSVRSKTALAETATGRVSVDFHLNMEKATYRQKEGRHEHWGFDHCDGAER
jgi:hypothetical protein